MESKRQVTIAPVTIEVTEVENGKNSLKYLLPASMTGSAFSKWMNENKCKLKRLKTS